MKNYIKLENGITLASLIITVIVMIILASVTSRMIYEEKSQNIKNKVENEYFKYERNTEDNIEAINSDWHKALNPGVDNNLISE